MAKICIILICAKKIFFGKIICSTHQRKCFSTILRNFWKIEFSKEYPLTFLLDNIFYLIWHQAVKTSSWDSYGH